jgi:hypothetical protein
MPIETDLKEIKRFNELHLQPDGMANITFKKEYLHQDGTINDAGTQGYMLDKPKVDAVLAGGVDVNLTLGQNMLLAIENAVRDEK